MSKQFNDTIIRAYKGEQTDYTPTWYMRQAGRSQPEYLKLKEKYSLFEITHQPELGAYVTRLPVENYDLRSEEHTSELQSRGHLVCRLLLEKKKNNIQPAPVTRNA